MGLLAAHRVGLTSEERAYAYMRTFGSVGLLLAYASGLVTFPPGPERTLYLVASLGFLAVSLAQGVAWLFFGLAPRRTLLVALPADMVWIALATASLVAYQDAGFVIAVVWPVFYALILRERQAWIAGGFIAVAYLCGHAAVRITDPGTYVALVLKASAIALLAGRVAFTEDRQRREAERAEQASEENSRLTTELSASLAELKALHEITAYLHSSLDLDDIGGPVLETIAGVFRFTTSCMYVHDKITDEVLYSASKGIPVGSALPRVPECESLIEDETLGVHLACTCPYENEHMRLVFCAPAEDLNALTAADHVLLQTVGREVALAVDHSQLYQLTKMMSITDELTGLYNYRYLQGRIEEEVARARRYSGFVSLLMIDADDFKAFNDMYGHVAGDKVLAELGAVLCSCVRETDVVARYGGEEFAVLAPETDMMGAMAIAEKLRDAVASRSFQAPYDRHLSVSVGLATYPSHGIDAESVLRAADDALYGAKNSGKNQVHTPGVYEGQPVW